MATSKTDIVIHVRASYANVLSAQSRPGQDPKFSITGLLPKSDVTGKSVLDQAVAAAIEKGVSTKWNGQRPAVVNVGVHDGDGPRPSDGAPYGPECRGMWVITASCSAEKPPFVVDRNVQPIIDPREVYSGMWVNLSLSLFPYNNNGKKGIGVWLNGLQKVRDDEPLGGRVTAESVFSAIPSAPTAPAAPAYSQPAAPAYGVPTAPAAPAYGVPTAPAAPAYGVPTAPAAPAAPAYGVPTAPAAPAAPAYGQPAAPQYDPITGQPIS